MGSIIVRSAGEEWGRRESDTEMEAGGRRGGGTKR